MSEVVFDVSYVACNYLDNANYYTCRNAATGDIGATGGVGQYYAVGYRVYRGFLFFDTSGLPDNAIITSAVISMGIATSGDQSDTDFNIILRSADSVGDAIVAGDYALTNYSGENFAEVNTSEVYRTITLNSDGIAHIKTGGMTKFVVLSEEDINNSPPTGKEYVIYSWYITGTVLDTITITYFTPTEAPTVVTINEDCEDRQSTTLTAVGEITGTGGGYTFRGFEYYEYDTKYDSSMYAVREIGRFSAPVEYRMTLSGLKPSTVYWIRSFAGNVYGISYGDWILCSTLGVPAVPSYGVYEKESTPTICFYISEDDGMTWGQKHGPYTTDQADIAITKLLVRGSGKKKIKFESDALTGISASVMCKLDIKVR